MKIGRGKSKQMVRPLQIEKLKHLENEADDLFLEIDNVYDNHINPFY